MCASQTPSTPRIAARPGRVKGVCGKTWQPQPSWRKDLRDLWRLATAAPVFFPAPRSLTTCSADAQKQVKFRTRGAQSMYLHACIAHRSLSSAQDAHRRTYQGRRRATTHRKIRRDFVARTTDSPQEACCRCTIVLCGCVRACHRLFANVPASSKDLHFVCEQQQTLLNTHVTL